MEDCHEKNATPEHEWLQKFVGSWRYTMTCDMGPDAGEWSGDATETVRAIGALWIVAEGSGATPGGGEMTFVMTLGYDPQKGRFVGSWAGSPMTHMFVYDGALDESGTVLTLDCEGPAFDDPTKTAHYRDVMTLRADGTRTHESRLKNDDGSWTTFMTGAYKRL